MTKLDLSCDEIYIIRAALNEVCHNIEIPEFELRIGYPEERVVKVFEKIDGLYKQAKQEENI